MAQHDYVIANDTAANVRADINTALQAIASNNSGATAPSTTYANQWWYDTATDTLKIRAEANDAWISVAILNQTSDQFFPIVGDVAVTASGTELNFVGGVTSSIQTQLNAKAPLASPTFTGVPAAPTAAAGTNTTQVATTAFVQDAVKATFLASQATTTGTAFDFTGIPSTAREVEVLYRNVSLSAADQHIVQLIVGGAPVASGYAASSGTSGAEQSATVGFNIYTSTGTQSVSGIMRLVRADTGAWVAAHSVSLGGAEANGGGFITGVGTVTGIRITRQATATFDAGTASVSYR